MNVKNKVSNEMILMGIAIGTIGLLIFLVNKIEVIAFDAKYYLLLSNTFIGENGEFSFLNYAKDINRVTLRGTSYSLWLFVINKISVFLNMDITIVNLIVNFFMFWFASFLMFDIFTEYKEVVDENKWKKKGKSARLKKEKEDIKNIRAIQGSFCVVFLFSIFARYSFTTLLSDLPALCTLLFGTYCFAKTMITEKFKLRLLYAFITGALLYTAYNIRTIYCFSGIIMVIIVIVHFIKNKDKQLLICFLVALIGVLVAATPQILANYSKFQIATMEVFSGGNPEATGLFTKQLFWGSSVQRYDTNMDMDVYDKNGFSLYWSGTQGLLGLDYEQSMVGYIKAILSNPLYFLALYIAHFLNLLSPYFREAYVSDLLCVKWPFLILMYTVCYIVCFDILNKFGTKEYTFKTLFVDKMLFAYILIIPVLAIVPGSVEHRFGIPLFFIIFYYLYDKCSWKDIFNRIKNNPVGNIAIYGALLMGMLNFWIDTLASGPIVLPL